MSIIQSIVDAALGSDQLSLADVDPNLLFLGALFIIFFSYIALRSLVRTIFSMKFW